MFDRYVPRGRGHHLDLATGELVVITTRGVPSDDWRRRWRVRIDALRACHPGLEALVDAGAHGPAVVFEVRAVPAMPAMPAAPRVLRGVPAAGALAWLRSRGLSSGPCRALRLLRDGRLSADGQTAWPIETKAERAAATRAWRCWASLLGPLPSVLPVWAPGPAPEGDDEFDARAGLVELRMPARDALWWARETGRMPVGRATPPDSIDCDLRARRSFLIVEPGRRRAAAWAASLATAGARRHYFIRPAARLIARERALSYASGSPAVAVPQPAHLACDARAQAVLARARIHFARRRLAAAIRTAGRAALLARPSTDTRAAAVLLKARALRCSGQPRDAGVLLVSELGANPDAGTGPLLTEAAEAACDEARLEQAEAFARAALLASTDALSERAARHALDRARVWRGEPAETAFWQARAAWQGSGGTPRWPAAGHYAHAPCGRLAAWEATCDRLERLLWLGEDTARLRTNLARAAGRFPPLLQARSAWLTSGDASPARRAGARGILQSGKAGVVMEIFEHMSAILSTCHGSGSDESVLAAVAGRTRRVLRARSVAVYAAGTPLPVAGDGDSWNAPSAAAARCMEAAHTTELERAGNLVCSAATVRGADGPVGALLATWGSESALEPSRVRLLLEAAALVIAPVLRGWAGRAAVPPGADMPEIVGVSPAIGAVRDAVRRVSQVPFPVLIEGESGCGKELVARAIHRLSPRVSRPFRALNCAAMAEELVEAELFGHAQGAYTGATTARAGLFEDADRGTLFLDEVSELSNRAQAKLLRVLQEGEVRRVGETVPRRVDVRIVAATNRSLAEAAGVHAFRPDLLFRLDVLRITVPPLRTRAEDIPLLCGHFWRDAAARAGTSALLSPEAVGRLAAYAWPGNVRELQNVMASMAVSSPRRGRAGLDQLPPHIRCDVIARPTLHQAKASLERDLVSGALARAGGRPGRAAAELGVSRQGLAKLMRRLGLPAA